MVAVLFFTAYHVSSEQPDETTSNLQEKSIDMDLNNCQVRKTAMRKWPSFKNTSYIYILGLFFKQQLSKFITPEERAMFMSAILLSQQKNITLNGKQFAYRLEETSGYDGIDALYSTCVSIFDNQILGIVGPAGSNEAKVIARFCNRAGLPVLGYSTTAPELSDRSAYQTFYRMSPSDTITAQALLKLFQRYDWNSTNIIYQDDSYGQGGLHALVEAFGSKIKISRKIKYDVFADQIDHVRYQLENSPSRIVLVWATPNITMRIIQLALKEGNILAPHFLWILTAANSRMQLNDKQLIGMLLIRSVSPQVFNIPINTTLLKDAIKIWKTYDCDSYPGDEKRIDAYALYAFDSAWMLISAFTELCQQKMNNCLSLVNTSQCFSGRLINRRRLHKIMQTMNFFGVSGYVKFHENTTDRFMNDGSQFIIDNLQPLERNTNKLQAVEVLRFNGTTNNMYYKSVIRWTETENVIRWPRGYGEKPLDYASLENETLNITVYISPPFYMETIVNYSNGTNGIEQEGYIFDLISLLEQRMKFRKNIIVAPPGTSYNELVNCVENGTCYIVMADLAKTASRLDKIDFSVSIYDSTMRLVIRKSKEMRSSMMAFLKPFHYSLWLGIFVIIYLFSMFTITIFEFIDGKERTANNHYLSDIYHESKIETLLNSMYHTAGSLMQTGSELHVRNVFARFQTILVWSMSVILVALFTSNMVQYFTIEREQPWIHNIEELKMCQAVKCSRIGVLQDSQHEEYFVKELLNGMEKNYYRLNHSIEWYRKLLDHHIDVAIADGASADYFTQTDYCDLEVVGLPFGRTNFAVAIPKQWPYKIDLDKHLMDLKTGLAIDNLVAKWFQQKNCDRKNKPSNDGFAYGLTLLQMQGLFVVFGVLTTINIILFIFRRLGFFDIELRQSLVDKIRIYFRNPIPPLSNQQ